MESAKQASATSPVDPARPSQPATANRIDHLAHNPTTQPMAATGAMGGATPTGQMTASNPLLSNKNLTDKEMATAVLKIAANAFAGTGNWVVFYRDILGVAGVVRQAFPTEEKYEAFQKTEQFAELQEMVAALRSQDTSKGDAVEQEKMITIRLPESLHKVLTAESESMNLSINKLCISKLLQPAEGRFVPVQQGRRRGRRPGPQGSRKKTAQ